MFVTTDSCVLTAKRPSRLQYAKIKEGSLKAFRLNTETLEFVYYTENKDFTVDYENGEVCLTENSAIPDFRGSVFYGVNPFDQDVVKSYGNDPYVVYFSYITEDEKPLIDVARYISLKNGNLHALSEYLKNFKKEELKLTVFGDSISTGCEAFPYGETYFSFFKKSVENSYGIKVVMRNASVGGDDTNLARARFEKDVMPFESDLTIVAFGMNDQNRFGDVLPVTPDIYEENVEYFAETLVKRGDKLLFVSPCECHKNWIHRSGRTGEYVEKLKEISIRYGSSFADVNALWNYALKRKSDDDLLRNGINHPNNYGHSIYNVMLETLL
ncbi:MAG: SGNH/GDSL hydrolase family protein [Christensenellaceae bacterium]|nr:SGNH/GDSL hydrolase family protein [Christensenellaceae bacterium]MDY2850731.1 SGNH/GDSL hydrolase family protein [Christensenellaceae bacterium]